MRQIFQSVAISAKKIQQDGEMLLGFVKNEHQKRPYIATGVITTISFTFAFGIAGGIAQLSNENTRDDFVAWSVCREKMRQNVPCTPAESKAHALMEPQQQKAAYLGSVLALTSGFAAGAIQRRRLKHSTP